jgi:2-hydroxychromene-2-carboxylate isomerase
VPDRSEPRARATSVEFFWDPMCPFAWVTSRWLVAVQQQRPLDVTWRLLSLRMLNEHRDYDTEMPPGYLDLHTRALRMCRVAAAVLEQAGHDAMGPLYTAFGTSIWDRTGVEGEKFAGIADEAHLRAVLEATGHDPTLAAAADTDRYDDLLRESTEEALTRAGGDVGTPVIAYDPPDGPAFFGPIISRIPSPAEAVELWDAFEVLLRWPSFAELKRSLREMPALALFAD